MHWYLYRAFSPIWNHNVPVVSQFNNHLVIFFNKENKLLFPVFSNTEIKMNRKSFQGLEISFPPLAIRMLLKKGAGILTFWNEKKCLWLSDICLFLYGDNHRFHIGMSTLGKKIYLKPWQGFFFIVGLHSSMLNRWVEVAFQQKSSWIGPCIDLCFWDHTVLFCNFDYQQYSWKSSVH